jgi:predicted O-methyltransferase YrrM
MFRKIQLIIRYIKFRWSSTDAHGIHSPFAFDLYTKAILGKTNTEAKNTLDYLRSKALADKRILRVIDFGTAEGEQGYRKLLVSYIALNYVSRKKKSELLFRLSEYFLPTSILEIGTSIGIGTTALALGSPNAKLISLEGSEEIAEVAKENYFQVGIKNVEVIVGEFSNALPLALEKFSTLDFIFVDGNHRSKPTLNYFELCLGKANENSVFVFDDIHWSADMENAWQQIQNHPAVTVTIDLFVVGLVFLRKGIAKQNFILQF